MFYEHYENICFTKAETFIFGKRKTKLLTTTATFQVFVPSSCTDNLIQKIKFRQLSMHGRGDAATWQIHLIISKTPKSPARPGKYIQWTMDKYIQCNFQLNEVAKFEINVSIFIFICISLFTEVVCLLLLQYPCIGPHPFHTPSPPTHSTLVCCRCGFLL